MVLAAEAISWGRIFAVYIVASFVPATTGCICVLSSRMIAMACCRKTFIFHYGGHYRESALYMARLLGSVYTRKYSGQPPPPDAEAMQVMAMWHPSKMAKITEILQPAMEHMMGAAARRTLYYSAAYHYKL